MNGVFAQSSDSKTAAASYKRPNSVFYAKEREYKTVRLDGWANVRKITNSQSGAARQAF